MEPRTDDQIILQAAADAGIRPEALRRDPQLLRKLLERIQRAACARDVDNSEQFREQFLDATDILSRLLDDTPLEIAPALPLPVESPTIGALLCMVRYHPHSGTYEADCEFRNAKRSIHAHRVGLLTGLVGEFLDEQVDEALQAELRLLRRRVVELGDQVEELETGKE